MTNEKRVNWKIFELQSILIGEEVDVETLQEAQEWLLPRQFEEVLEERNHEGRCGYPMCNNILSKVNTKVATYDVDKFCSIDCENSCQMFTGKLSTALPSSRPIAKEEDSLLAQWPSDVMNILSALACSPPKASVRYPAPPSEEGPSQDGALPIAPPPQYKAPANMSSTGGAVLPVVESAKNAPPPKPRPPPFTRANADMPRPPINEEEEEGYVFVKTKAFTSAVVTSEVPTIPAADVEGSPSKVDAAVAVDPHTSRHVHHTPSPEPHCSPSKKSETFGTPTSPISSTPTTTTSVALPFDANADVKESDRVVVNTKPVEATYDKAPSSLSPIPVVVETAVATSASNEEVREELGTPSQNSITNISSPTVETVNAAKQPIGTVTMVGVAGPPMTEVAATASPSIPRSSAEPNMPGDDKAARPQKKLRVRFNPKAQSTKRTPLVSSSVDSALSMNRNPNSSVRDGDDMNSIASGIASVNIRQPSSGNINTLSGELGVHDLQDEEEAENESRKAQEAAAAALLADWNQPSALSKARSKNSIFTKASQSIHSRVADGSNAAAAIKNFARPSIIPSNPNPPTEKTASVGGAMKASSNEPKSAEEIALVDQERMARRAHRSENRKIKEVDWMAMHSAGQVVTTKVKMPPGSGYAEDGLPHKTTATTATTATSLSKSKDDIRMTATTGVKSREKPITNQRKPPGRSIVTNVRENTAPRVLPEASLASKREEDEVKLKEVKEILTSKSFSLDQRQQRNKTKKVVSEDGEGSSDEDDEAEESDDEQDHGYIEVADGEKYVDPTTGFFTAHAHAEKADEDNTEDQEHDAAIWKEIFGNDMSEAGHVEEMSEAGHVEDISVETISPVISGQKRVFSLMWCILDDMLSQHPSVVHAIRSFVISLSQPSQEPVEKEERKPDNQDTELMDPATEPSEDENKSATSLYVTNNATKYKTQQGVMTNLLNRGFMAAEKVLSIDSLFFSDDMSLAVTYYAVKSFVLSDLICWTYINNSVDEHAAQFSVKKAKEWEFVAVLLIDAILRGIGAVIIPTVDAGGDVGAGGKGDDDDRSIEWTKQLLQRLQATITKTTDAKHTGTHEGGLETIGLARDLQLLRDFFLGQAAVTSVHVGSSPAKKTDQQTTSS